MRAADFLRDSDLRASPGGDERSLGHEIDAVLGLEEWRHVRIEVVGSVFRAGSAFEELRGEMAYEASAKLELVF